jgi:putative salt-induced outer membrane protein YdiY
MCRIPPIVLILVAFPALCFADEVRFKNGDRVNGKVTWQNGKVTISESVFGTVSADAKEVESFTSAEPLTYQPPATTTSTTTTPSVTTTAPATTTAMTSVATTTASTTTAVAAAPVPPAPPPKKWSGSVVAGAIVTRGNSVTESYRVAADATRKGENNTLSLSAAYAFGQNKDLQTGTENTTTDTWFGQAKLDHSLGEKLYDYALFRIEQDNVADLNLRITPGVGLGYRWINKPETHFNTEGGLTWVYESYDNTTGTTEHFAARLAYHVDHKLNDKVSLVHNFEYLPNVSAIDDFNLNIDAGVRAMLTTAMFLETKIVWQHDSTPAPDAQPDDLLFSLGVGWNF